MDLSLILIGVVVLLGLAAWWLRSRRNTGAVAETVDRIDTVIGWPPQATRVLANHERIAYATLVRALPECLILMQVPFSRFLKVPKRNSYAEWLRRLGHQCADFVVCDMTTQVIAVVELESPQPNERTHKRLIRLRRSLKAAKIPLHTWTENALPGVEAVRDAILPKPEPAAQGSLARAEPAMAPAAVPLVAVPASATTAATVAAAAAAVAGAAASAPNPFDELDRDSTQDEWIELLEPPPTWFDDFDSDTVPLKD
ncbi:MAG: DUF2726 domain-containing protein [Burkholderiaceae bacterium]